MPQRCHARTSTVTSCAPGLIQQNGVDEQQSGAAQGWGLLRYFCLGPAEESVALDA